jgi:1-acyl-sn-glycerol-3-phosphate acyltransferase
MGIRVTGSLAAAWLRRSVSFSVLFLLWFVCTFGFPIGMLFALILDGFQPGRRFPRLRCVLFFMLFLNCEIIGLVLSFWVWLAALFARPAPEEYLLWNQKLQALWTASLLHGAMRIFSMKLVAEGKDQICPGPILLFVRHSSSADTVLPTVLVTAAHGMRLRFILKKELLWDPCLDVIGNRLPNVFIDRTGKQTARELAAIRHLVENTGDREGVLLYPEGTRFSEEKRRRYVQRLADTAPSALHQTAARFRHVLPPRPGGALAAMASAPETAVVFCMHTGLEGSANFHEFWNGGLIGTTIQVAFQRAEPDTIPVDPESRVQWLYDKWLEVDDWIDRYRRKKEGSSPMI